MIFSVVKLDLFIRALLLDRTSARPEVRGTADVGWRSLNPLPIGNNQNNTQSCK